MKKNLFITILILLAGAGCSSDERSSVKMDTKAPGSVSNVQVENIPGGAILRYQLPDDEDLLFVKADYALKAGVKNETKASLYIDTIKITGYATRDEQTVTLIAVDKSMNESIPVDVKIQPLEAPVITIRNSIKLIPDFGGIHASWTNETQAEISVILEKKDEFDEFVPLNIAYSSMKNGRMATRGMDTIPQTFRIFVQDRWNNKSDMLEVTLCPLFEEKFDRFKFAGIEPEGDELFAWGWVISNVFDGKIEEPGFHTAGGTGRWPQSMSMDMGQTGKISRIKLWQRFQNDYLFRWGNLKRFELWGAKEGANLDSWDSWIKLFDGESIKPSGLPSGQYSAEDMAYVKAGEEFICPPEMPEVRYIRIKALETWGADFFHFNEIEVYGKVEKK